MDFDLASQASAIDNAVFPINAARISATTPHGDTQDDAQFMGLQSGHWTVLSTANGSAIDDRTPTILGFRSRSLSEDAMPDRVQRVDEAVLRKLAAATEKERKDKEDEAKSRGDWSSADEDVKQQNRLESEKETKGFYIPRLRGMLIVCCHAHKSGSLTISLLLQIRAVSGFAPEMAKTKLSSILYQDQLRNQTCPRRRPRHRRGRRTSKTRLRKQQV